MVQFKQLLKGHRARKWQSQNLHSAKVHPHNNYSVLSLLLETKRQRPIIFFKKLG